MVVNSRKRDKHWKQFWANSKFLPVHLETRKSNKTFEMPNFNHPKKLNASSCRSGISQQVWYLDCHRDKYFLLLHHRTRDELAFEILLQLFRVGKNVVISSIRSFGWSSGYIMGSFDNIFFWAEVIRSTEDSNYLQFLFYQMPTF